jgi:drug/metabolite transporter (DMT)-like permease
MSNQESNAQYQQFEDEATIEQVLGPDESRPKSLMWVFYSCIATVCFAISAYILGIISVGGVSAKFLNSFGYLFISIVILTTKNVRFYQERQKLFKKHPEKRNELSSFASLKDSCYYDSESGYKLWGLTLSFACGALNLAGEFCIIFSFQHAVEAAMNQGILTSIFTIGSIVVLVGSVIFLKEKVRFCEYMGVVLVIGGTVLLSFSKAGEEAPEPVFDNAGNQQSGTFTIEGPGLAIMFAILGGVAFGVRGLILKYMGVVLGIDGISASSIFLITDGIVGGTVGLVISLLGGGYSAFPVSYIILGICSGCLAGTGVLCLNIAIMTGLAGPAVAIGNLSSVIQTFLDWGFLGQVPSLLEGLGLAIAVFGAILMAIGDDFAMKPLFYPDPKPSKRGRKSQKEDLEITNDIRGEYKNPNVEKKSEMKDFLEKESKPKHKVGNGKKSDKSHSPESNNDKVSDSKKQGASPTPATKTIKKL